MSKINWVLKRGIKKQYIENYSPSHKFNNKNIFLGVILFNNQNQNTFDRESRHVWEEKVDIKLHDPKHAPYILQLPSLFKMMPELNFKIFITSVHL